MSKPAAALTPPPGGGLTPQDAPLPGGALAVDAAGPAVATAVPPPAAHGVGRSATARRWPGLIPGLVSLALLLAVWGIAAALGDDPQRLPSPALVLTRLVELAASGELWLHLGMTLGRVGAAFAAAMLIGGALGLWMGRVPAADRWLNPSLLVLLNIPALVVIVLCYIWIGLNETAAVLALSLIHI